MTKVVGANRTGGGPEGVMQIIEDSCDSKLNHIDDVISHQEFASGTTLMAIRKNSLDEFLAALIIP